MLSNTNTRIRYYSLSTEEFAEKGKRYDLSILFGMGLKPDSLQRMEIQRKMKRGDRIMTIFSTSPDRNFTNVDSLNYSNIQAYIGAGSKKNYQSLANYIRKQIDKKRFGVQPYEEVSDPPADVYWDIDESVAIATKEEYDSHLRAIGQYYEGAPSIVIAGVMSDPYGGNKAYLDSLLLGLRKKELNVYPIYAMTKLEKMLRDVKPDAILYFAHGRLLTGEAGRSLLRDLDAPVLTLLTLLTDRESWLKDPQGMSGGFFSQSIVVPEVDGGTYPVALATQEEKDGVVRTVSDSLRLEKISAYAQRLSSLKMKSPGERKLVVYYFQGLGKDVIQGQGLEGVPSLYKVLSYLKERGYKISLPETIESFRNKLISSEKTVDIDEYLSWCKKRLSATSFEEVVRQYGEPSRDRMNLRILDLGNVALVSQPLSAYGTDTFRIVHGVKVPPPHEYIAAYLWADQSYHTDVMMHFGTHGSFEFLPGKQIALSDKDWSDILIGSTPHTYCYTIANVGEAMIAKRRGYATLMSYLTPAFEESKVRGQLSLLEKAVEKYHALRDDKNITQASLEVKSLAMSLGLHRDLKLDTIPNKPYTDEEIHKIEDFAAELTHEKIYTRLYTMGEAYTPTQIQQTLMALTMDPLAYQLASIDRWRGILSAQDYNKQSVIASRYIPRVRSYISSILAGARPDTLSLLRLANFSDKEMSMYRENKDEELSLLIRKLYDVGTTLPQYKESLMRSPDLELESIYHALEGRFISPSPGGDPIANPQSLPTGRNLYSINPESTPSEAAWTRGKELAESTIEYYRKSHDGQYPRQISYTFWSSEFIESQGASLAQALYILGVEPVRDRMGRVQDLRLIPLEELGRPRIDILVQTSGQFRDLAASRLDLLDKAVKLAASAKEDADHNYVREGAVEMERALVNSGLPPSQARRLSTARLFGGLNGIYGTGIQGMIRSGDRWESTSEIAETYLHNMGALYTNSEEWGEFTPNLFRTAMSRTDMVMQPRQSHTWGALSLDHVFEFMGGLNLAVTTVTGKQPETMLMDYRNHHRYRVQDLREAVGVESRTTILNPHYVKGVVSGGVSEATRISEIVENMYGWEVTKPDLIDDQMWDEVYDTWVADKQNLGTREFFDKANPAALEQITGVMLETVRKGLWNISSTRLHELIKVNQETIARNGITPGSVIESNPRLREYITKNSPLAGAEQVYDVKRLQKDGMVLKEEKVSGANQDAVSSVDQPSTLRSVLVISGVILGLALLLVLFLRKRSSERDSES